MKKFLKNIGRAIVKGAIWIYCKVVFWFTAEGTENIPKTGPVIICANHRTLLDGPLIMVSCPRFPRFLAKAELAKSKFLRTLGKLFDIIFVSYNAKDIEVLKESFKNIKKWRLLSIISRRNKKWTCKRNKSKRWSCFFAVRTGAPVVPCGIKGGVKGDWKATVVYGKPLDFSKYKGSKDKEVLDKVTEEIMNSIIELTK